jgi:hypothetical protein
VEVVTPPRFPLKMKPLPLPPADAALAERICCLACLVDQLPTATPAALRRLLRSAYNVHRMVEAIGNEPSDNAVWTLAAAIEGLKATALEARASGADERTVQQLVDMSLASAIEVVDRALPFVDLDEFPHG